LRADQSHGADPRGAYPPAPLLRSSSKKGNLTVRATIILLIWLPFLGCALVWRGRQVSPSTGELKSPAERSPVTVQGRIAGTPPPKKYFQFSYSRLCCTGSLMRKVSSRFISRNQL